MLHTDSTSLISLKPLQFGSCYILFASFFLFRAIDSTTLPLHNALFSFHRRFLEHSLS